MGFLRNFFGKGQTVPSEQSSRLRWKESKQFHPDAKRRREFVKTLDDQPLLAKVAREDPSSLIREDAMKRITDLTLLTELALDHELETAANAVMQIEDSSTLERLIPAILPRLLDGLASPYGTITYSSKRALCKIGDPAVEGLLRVATSAHSGVTKNYARHVLEDIGTPGAREAIRSLENADVVAQESEEFRVLRAYWRARAIEYWEGRVGGASCDSCNADISRRGGYLCGSRLNCERCCGEMLEADALEALRRNPDYFGPGELSAARRWSG